MPRPMRRVLAEVLRCTGGWLGLDAVRCGCAELPGVPESVPVPVRAPEPGEGLVAASAGVGLAPCVGPGVGWGPRHGGWPLSVGRCRPRCGWAGRQRSRRVLPTGQLPCRRGRLPLHCDRVEPRRRLRVAWLPYGWGRPSLAARRRARSRRARRRAPLPRGPNAGGQGCRRRVWPVRPWGRSPSAERRRTGCRGWGPVRQGRWGSCRESSMSGAWRPPGCRERPWTVGRQPSRRRFRAPCHRGWRTLRERRPLLRWGWCSPQYGWNRSPPVGR